MPDKFCEKFKMNYHIFSSPIRIIFFSTTFFEGQDFKVIFVFFMVTISRKMANPYKLNIYRKKGQVFNFKIFRVRISGSNFLGETFKVKFSGSNFHGQIFRVKFSDSNFQGPIFGFKFSGSNFHGNFQRQKSSNIFWVMFVANQGHLFKVKISR